MLLLDRFVALELRKCHVAVRVFLTFATGVAGASVAAVVLASVGFEAGSEFGGSLVVAAVAAVVLAAAADVVLAAAVAVVLAAAAAVVLAAALAVVCLFPVIYNAGLFVVAAAAAVVFAAAAAVVLGAAPAVFSFFFVVVLSSPNGST